MSGDAEDALLREVDPFEEGSCQGKIVDGGQLHSMGDEIELIDCAREGRSGFQFRINLGSVRVEQIAEISVVLLVGDLYF
jgi:hypothetical protein